MNGVYFLVNSMSEFDFEDGIREFLPDTKVAVGESFPGHPEEYALVVLWSIRKILPAAAGLRNVIVFHSSDLPRGKGWAPVYHAIADREEAFTVCGMLPAEGADDGEIVVKASFPMRPEYTASLLREWDHRICLLLIARLLERFPEGRLRGAPQSGEATWHPKRKPSDNEIDASLPLARIMNHLRACEPRHPAYLFHEGVKYRVTVEPEIKPSFPSDILIRFHDSP